MLLTISHTKNSTLVECSGDLDIDTCPELKATLLSTLPVDSLTLDINKVDFMGASALTVFLDLDKRQKKDTNLFYLNCSNPLYLKILKITDVDKLLAVV